jgi:hypothetical protein
VGAVESYTIAIDDSANIYWASYFDCDSVGFGNIELYNNDPNPSYDSHFFITKYDSAGNAVWAKTAHGNGGVYAKGIAINNQGQIYLTGEFTGDSVNFGHSTLFNAGTSINKKNFFVVRYNAAGDEVWAVGGQGFSGGSFISTDDSAHVYITGSFTRYPFTIGTTTLYASDTTQNRFFLAKFDEEGNLIWVNNPTGSYNILGDNVAADLTGNIYVAGSYNSDSMVFNGHTLINPYPCTVSFGCTPTYFLAKYDAAGNIIWVEQAPNKSGASPHALSATADGHVVVTGGFNQDTAMFGTSMVIMPAVHPDPIFLLEYDTGGIVICSTALGSGGDDAYGLAMDNNGNGYLVSDLMCTPNLIIGTDTLDCTGGEYAYVVKFRFGCGKDSVLGTENIAGTVANLQIYPNPSTGRFTIQLPGNQGSYTATIYNTLEQKVEQLNLSSTQNIINLSMLPTGIYFVAVQTENGSAGAKLAMVR